MKDVKEILDEMGHALSMKAVRGFAYFLIKVFKALFKRVYVNEEGVQMVRTFLFDYRSNIYHCHLLVCRVKWQEQPAETALTDNLISINQSIQFIHQ